ncbi:lamin tail domain-containing protein [Streptomyces sp. NBC_01762]|uniref:endonuclease/exonuclease/phosphatase family protein n=1 Tax=unclassified Streptomyces TaxID=2593676 RepID=UPI002DDC14BC|nr:MULTISPECIES: endonuclease/exonuclease/phosphatase family protein [unclassified Streptomyces]WSC48155.1 lamin tail domain-containing protein [Streptomyces sp. NBC_01762]WSD27804.1 lamin tail domain-containing protein [Streptomyces sp. NBC_01751]WSJ50253.1 lamin tail domain-containing protein [Streptomyces sp. NBC_01318]
MHISRPRSVLLAGAVAVTLSATALPAAFAAPSSTAVISEVYGGGGNSGATLTRDFIELANAGSSAYDLSGFSVQYLPGSPSAGSLWQVSALTGSVAPGGRYLVAQAAGTGGTVALPTPDATGTVAMSATSGTVALVSGTTPLTCKTAADCAADTRIVDLVGYGSAVVREGSGPVTGTSATASVARAASLADTDDNAADLSAGAPTPVNAAGETSGGAGPGDPGNPTEPGTVRVHDIQGTTRVSPLDGQSVTGVPGIVTGVRTSGSRGFWIQDATPDADSRTGEGVFVFTGSAAPAVAVGDSVLVSGKVDEYYPSATTQSITEITAPRVTVLSSGNALPAPVVLDAASVPDAYVPSADGGSIDALALDPATYALDRYESLEGTRVKIADTRVTGATTAYHEVWVTIKPNENPTGRGGTLYSSYTDQNTGRIKVMSLDTTRPVPVANVGDVLSGTTTGVLDYDSFGGYNLQATELGTLTDHHLRREVTRKQKGKELSVATYNVENLDALDEQGKFDTLAAGVAVNLSSPDIVSLEEIQDDNGAVNDGTVGSDATLKRFTDAIVAAGGPQYAWRYIAPENGKDGGEPGGNIRNVFLFNPERVDFVDRPGGDATTAVTAVETKKGVTLSASPGRIAPTSDAWDDSRKPLVGEFRFHGKPVFVIGNHFASKGGDQPLHGRYQEPTRSSETKRVKQATEVNTFVKSLLAADKSARVITLGDLNDFAFSPTMAALTDGRTLKPLITTLPKNEQYSYVYEGNSQTLDHILISPGVRCFDYDVVHINAEFADQASDHDPQIVRVDVNAPDHGHH